LNPLWSPDGKWIFFTANKNGARNIYRVPANGSGPTEPVLETNEDLNLEDISSNSRFLVFNFRPKGTDLPSVGLLSLPDKRRVVFASAPARAARLSPNQKWMAYTSNRFGSVIAVRRVGPAGQPIGDEQIVSSSSGSATTSMWRADGKELFYLESGRLMSVQIETNGDRLIAGAPRTLFKIDVEDEERRNRYLVAKDGLFLMILKTAN
jgi:Tol biopolymer transport system component